MITPGGTCIIQGGYGNHGRHTIQLVEVGAARIKRLGVVTRGTDDQATA